MYPDSFHQRPTDDMDPVARREFFGPGGRQPPASEPNIVPMQGNGIDTPVTPDPTVDHPFSARRKGASDE
jgi:hypothetical protein